MTESLQTVDVDSAFESYATRFHALFGERPSGTFVKFGNTMVQKLSRGEFEERLTNFLKVRKRCKRMLESGATISDAITLDFEEAAAWLAIEPPNLLDLFHGEMGEIPGMRPGSH